MNIPDKAIRVMAERRLRRAHDKNARLHAEERWPYWADESEEYRETQIGYIWDDVKGDLAAAAPFIAAQAWAEGADTALNFAYLNDDGITLDLFKPNPYAQAEEG